MERGSYKGRFLGRSGRSYLEHVTPSHGTFPGRAKNLPLKGSGGEVGPSAAPLLPRLVPQLAHPDEWQHVPAARAVWRICHDADLVAPVLVAAAGPTPAGLQALETLAELSAAAFTPLTTRLQEWIEADLRPFRFASVDDLVENDERLVALCRDLLARVNNRPQSG